MGFNCSTYIGHFNFQYTDIYSLNVEDFAVEIHHGDFLYISFHVKNSKTTLHTRLLVSRSRFDTVVSIRYKMYLY